MNIYFKETKEILKVGLEAFQFHTELHQIHFKKLSSENVLFLYQVSVNTFWQI